ncbi:MAG: 23S rRNA (guanosine(2251)-2'-O)-methyltransferase RlmB [Chitinophagaceae bacterium]|nr:MAG: 23S rRNA (guanosine(2251)-2'-O)-methyltransferase RlmB [Chitinophagaceae bacterium]
MAKNNDLIFGRLPVLEQCEASAPIEKIWVQAGMQWKDMPAVRKYAADNNIPLQSVPFQKLNKMVKGNHQGVVAQMALVDYVSLQQLINHIYDKGEDPFLIVLEDVTDTRNLGGIARTALCSGAHGIVIPKKGTAIIHGETVKSSAGAILNIEIARENTISDILDILKSNGIPVYGADAGSKESMYDINWKEPSAIVMGGEQHGISQKVKDACKSIFSIPMPGKFDSLNVGVATGVVAFEVVRQRFYPS